MQFGMIAWKKKLARRTAFELPRLSNRSNSCNLEWLSERKNWSAGQHLNCNGFQAVWLMEKGWDWGEGWGLRARASHTLTLLLSYKCVWRLRVWHLASILRVWHLASKVRPSHSYCFSQRFMLYLNTGCNSKKNQSSWVRIICQYNYISLKV